MTTTVTSKGQVTIPKQIRESLKLMPGSEIVFSINENGDLIMRKVKPEAAPKANRFEAARGTATIKWRTDELMTLLRGE